MEISAAVKLLEKKSLKINGERSMSGGAAVRGETVHKIDNYM